ncbi:MAG: hypothetical protein KAJ90_07520, partial [Desulfobacterales bacterium]|nr:hypothetical protein [Desulfobacterales bacterium]
LTWVLFRSPDFPSGLVYLKGLFRFHQFTDLSTAVLFAGSLMIALDIAQIWSRSHTWLTDHHEIRIVRYSVAQLLFVSVLTASIAHIQTITPFIYFQF